MGIFDKKTVSFAATELSGLDIAREDFAKKMLSHVYEKVLFLPLSMIGGEQKIQDAVLNSAADHYSPKSRGFVHWTAKAMAEQSRIVLVKDKQKDGSYLFKRDSTGSAEITPDKLVIDFVGYESTDLLKAYFELMYEALDGAAKGVKSSQGLIVYLEKLQESLTDSKAVEIIEGQIKALSDSVKGGDVGYASGGSKIEFIKFDIDPTSKAIEFCYSQIAGHLGLPVSVINGIGGSAMSDTGESDRKQTRKAAEYYFISIVRPILNSIFQKSGFELEEEIENMESLSEVIMLIETSTVISDAGKKKLAAMVNLGEEDLELGRGSNASGNGGRDID